jgi:hypothetical protein
MGCSRKYKSACKSGPALVRIGALGVTEGEEVAGIFLKKFPMLGTAKIDLYEVTAQGPPGRVRNVHQPPHNAEPPRGRGIEGRIVGSLKKFQKILSEQWSYGGARRSRTADLLNAIQALSQLSYGPDQGTGIGNQQSETITKSDY